MTEQIESVTTPVVCTLAAGDLSTQRRRWERLGADALVERVKTEDGLRLSFRADAGVVRELQELAAVERECCAWATWTVHESGGQVTLDVSSTGEGVAALHRMFTSFEEARVV